jgi:N-acetylmuramoyl-L-alanine amidase
MRVSTILDPGHGGTAVAGRSTPFGIRSPQGLFEKDVTLQIGLGVEQRLRGESRLTRYGDVNLSLADRARGSRDLDARAFVSIHANGGGRGARGMETWVHTHGSRGSLALAEELESELARLGAPDRGLYRGDLAVLSPTLHRPETDACLIEIDHLDHPDGARRLSDPRQLDALAAGIARALTRHLSRGARSGAYSFGRPSARGLDAALDLTDFDENGYSIIPADAPNRVPNNVTQAELDQLKRSWDCMMRGKGIKLQGSAADQSTFRVMLHGQMRLSQVVRDQFLLLACDEPNTVTFDLVRNGANVFVDLFRTEVSNAGVARGTRNGFHTIDLNDFEQIPQVSGNPRNFMYLQGSILVHALREAREGMLNLAPDAYRACHNIAIGEENRFRVEQGQVGQKPLPDPPQTVVGNDLRVHWRFFTGARLAESETWHVTRDPASPDLEITSIDYDPLP